MELRRSINNAALRDLQKEASREGFVSRMVPRCSHEGCTNKVIKGGVCVTPGAVFKRCAHAGCTNGAINGGVWVTHGATRK